MTPERMLQGRNTSELVAVFGSMYSGKTGELLEQLYLEETFSGHSVLLFKPSIDTRYSETEVVSHAGKRREYLNVDIDSPEQMIASVLEAEKDGVPVDVIGIDETQFFDSEKVIEAIEEFLAHGKKVIVAGLPTDFRDEGFGAMPILISKADVRVPRTARCMYQDEDGKKCGSPASKTQRIVDGRPAFYEDPIVLVGATEAYEARCRRHHTVSHRS